MNQGIHTADLLLWLLGPVRRVSAKAVTALHPIEVEDTVVALLEFENGAVGTLEATTAAYPGYRRRVELTGTEGTVIVEHDRLVAADLRAARRRTGRRGASGPERQRVIARRVGCARAPAAVRGLLRRDSNGTGAPLQRALRAPERRSRPRDLRRSTNGRLGYAVPVAGARSPIHDPHRPVAAGLHPRATGAAHRAAHVLHAQRRTTSGTCGRPAASRPRASGSACRITRGPTWTRRSTCCRDGSDLRAARSTTLPGARRAAGRPDAYRHRAPRDGQRRELPHADRRRRSSRGPRRVRGGAFRDRICRALRRLGIRCSQAPMRTTRT